MLSYRLRKIHFQVMLRLKTCKSQAGCCWSILSCCFNISSFFKMSGTRTSPNSVPAITSLALIFVLFMWLDRSVNYMRGRERGSVCDYLKRVVFETERGCCFAFSSRRWLYTWHPLDWLVARLVSYMDGMSYNLPPTTKTLRFEILHFLNFLLKLEYERLFTFGGCKAS